jgi:hypothetical protein
VLALSRIGWSGGEYRSEVVLADVELTDPVPPDTVHVMVTAPGADFLVSVGRIRYLATAGNANGAAHRDSPRRATRLASACYRVWFATGIRRSTSTGSIAGRGTGVAIIRPHGFLGFQATSVNRREVGAWLARIAVESQRECKTLVMPVEAGWL